MACSPSLFSMIQKLYGCATKKISWKTSQIFIMDSVTPTGRRENSSRPMTTGRRRALYKERLDREQECRIQNLLGRVAFLQGEHQQATDHYMESISLAVLLNMPSMQFINFVALAELRRDEGRLEEARSFCSRAEEVARQMRDDHHLFGMMHIACGKISLTEAERAEGEERTRLLREALNEFLQAEQKLKQTQAGMHSSELYGHLAQINEALGNSKEALAYWKLACNVVPQREM